MRAQLAVTFLALTLAAPAHATRESLGAQYQQSQQQLAHNAFGRPLLLESREGKSSLTGEAWARLDQPFAAVSEKLHDPSSWCELLLLPFNIKQCSAGGATLKLNVGRKADQELDDTYRLDFAWESKSEDGYMQVTLKAPEGPVGTKDYEIVFEAVPVEEGKTYLHLSYSYAYSFTSKLATQAYFATTARDKIGFTKLKGKGGEPQPVGGLRGAIERNAMRYVLAIESFLAAGDVSDADHFELASARWFDATEKYAPQLHEMERAEYLAMKKKEWLRQKSSEAQGQQASR